MRPSTPKQRRQARTVLEKNEFSKAHRKSILDRSRAKTSPFHNLTAPIRLCILCGGFARSSKKIVFEGRLEKTVLRSSRSKFSPFHELTTANWLCTRAKCAPSWKKLNFGRRVKNRSSIVAAQRSPHSMISERTFRCTYVAGPHDLAKKLVFRRRQKIIAPPLLFKFFPLE